MTTPAELLGMRTSPGATAAFELGSEWLDASGAVAGGVVAACALLAAREVAGRRRPYALDCRFVAGLSAGDCTARAMVLAEGRTSTTVQVVLIDAGGRICCAATASLAADGALAERDVESAVAPPAGSYADAVPWTARGGLEVPILDTLSPRALDRDVPTITTAIRLPWAPEPDHAAESACVAADLCVGPPVAAALQPDRMPHTSTDLSLRFCGDELGAEVYGTGRLARVAGGIAAVDVTVTSRRRLLAVGVSTSLLVAPELEVT